MKKLTINEKITLLLLLILSPVMTQAQEVALKTNLLGWASTSCNAGVELGTGKKTTFQLFGTLNPLEVLGRQEVEILECDARVQMVHLSEVWRSLHRNTCFRRRIQC